MKHTRFSALKKKTGTRSHRIWLLASILAIAGVSSGIAQDTSTAGTTSPGTPATPASKDKNKSQAPATDSTGKKTTSSSTQTQLDRVVVTGSDISAQDVAQYNLSTIPGAAYLKDSSVEYKRKTTSLTAADLLQNTPGVYAQAEGGNQGFRLSIRGSSIANTNTYKFGVGFYFDGLFFPGIAQAGAPPFIFEPLAVDYTEILVGANAFGLQTLDLGGAINFVDHTGYNSSPFQARFDAGSFGYYKGQVSSGLVEGPADYYISVTQAFDEGFQAHTRELGTRVVGSVGYQITPDISNRFYYRFGREYFKNGGLLTNAQISKDPQQANTAQVAQNAYYDIPDNFWFGDKAILKLDADSSLETGISYDYSWMYSNANGVPAAYAVVYAEQNVSPVVTYKRSDLFFDHQSNSELAVRNTTVFNSYSRSFDYTVTTSPTYGQQVRAQTQGGTTQTIVSFSNDSELVHNLWLKGGISGIYWRDVNVYEQNNTPGAKPIYNGNDDQGHIDYAAVLGLRYEFSPDTQVFTSLSRSVEPPTASTLGNTTTNSSSNILNAQTATTAEVGGRAKLGIFTGSLSYYHSWVDNELLTVATQLSPTVLTQTLNASPTVHQGVDLGLQTALWTARNSTEDHPNRLTLNQTYTYSDFQFVNDPAWGHNHLPAIPQNFYQAELLYEHPTGLYAGVNLQYSSQRYEDFQNSIWAPSYVTFGAKVGYAPAKQPWEVHLEFKNITDQKYAAYIRQVAAAKGVDSAVSAPADGFGVFGGASYHF